MSIDFEKVAEAIEKSSQEIKNLMFSAELGDKIGIIAEENHLEEETAFKLFDEVGYVILDLKSRFSFFDSLVDIGIDKVAAQKIVNGVGTEIFSELDKIKNKSQEEKKEVQEEPVSPQNNVGTDFEQIILNQARAMQPAQDSSKQQVASSQVPKNLPTEQEKPRAIHNYIGESDPYREPME